MTEHDTECCPDCGSDEKQRRGLRCKIIGPHPWHISPSPVSAEPMPTRVEEVCALECTCPDGGWDKASCPLHKIVPTEGSAPRCICPTVMDGPNYNLEIIDTCSVHGTAETTPRTGSAPGGMANCGHGYAPGNKDSACSICNPVAETTPSTERENRLLKFASHSSGCDIWRQPHIYQECTCGFWEFCECCQKSKAEAERVLGEGKE